VREGIRVREIGTEEGHRLPRIVRPSSGSVVTWRRVPMVLSSAQGRTSRRSPRWRFTSEDRVRAVLHNINDDAIQPYPKYAGGRPPAKANQQHPAGIASGLLVTEPSAGTRVRPLASLPAGGDPGQRANRQDSDASLPEAGSLPPFDRLGGVGLSIPAAEGGSDREKDLQ
jgi:hypothetical protein